MLLSLSVNFPGYLKQTVSGCPRREKREHITLQIRRIQDGHEVKSGQLYLLNGHYTPSPPRQTPPLGYSFAPQADLALIWLCRFYMEISSTLTLLYRRYLTPSFKISALYFCCLLFLLCKLSC